MQCFQRHARSLFASAFVIALRREGEQVTFLLKDLMAVDLDAHGTDRLKISDTWPRPSQVANGPAVFRSRSGRGNYY